ncbi:hypothetical protein ACA910_016610 [Epithemia clementina (nom. ined.)]
MCRRPSKTEEPENSTPLRSAMPMFLPEHIRLMLSQSAPTIVVDNCLSHDVHNNRRKRVERTRSDTLPRQPTRRHTNRSKSDTLLLGVSRWMNETHPDAATKQLRLLSRSKSMRECGTKAQQQQQEHNHLANDNAENNSSNLYLLNKPACLDDAAPRPPRRSNSFRELVAQVGVTSAA